MPRSVRHATLADLIARVRPGCELVDSAPLGAEQSSEGDVTTKGTGYGKPVKLVVKHPDEREEILVFRTASADRFGHDWRSDRAAEMLLAYDTFEQIPNHITPIDVGAIEASGATTISVRGTNEFYLLTSFVPGELYATQLRRIVTTGSLTDSDRELGVGLAVWLAKLHTPIETPELYSRSLRDVIGSGEGIFGIIDGYPPNLPSSLWRRLQHIETRCVEWRWKLRSRSERLCRIHGDFHPYNVICEPSGDFTLLDASRGSIGDPANDLACMGINYLFFPIANPQAWHGGFRELWFGFWKSYQEARPDDEVYDCLAPYFAWRGLVLANPRWYPAMEEETRERLLSLVERVLESPRMHPEFAEDLFR